MEEKYYGVLMNRKFIDEGIYLYTPVYLIEGSIDEDDKEVYFRDTMDEEYLTVNDTETIVSGIETAVGYIVSETDLLSRYPDSTIEEAKAEYFDSIREVTHIGYYLVKEDKIALVGYKFGEMCAKLNTMDFDPNASTVTVPLDAFADKKEDDANQDALSNLIDEYGGQEVICLSFEEFKKIMELGSYEEIKASLEEVYRKVNEMNAVFLDEMSKEENNDEKIAEHLTGDLIVKSFDSICDGIYYSTDANEIKELIEAFISTITHISLILDVKGMGYEEPESVNEYIYTLADIFDEVLDHDSVEEMREAISKIKQEERQNVKQIGQVFDKYSKLYDLEKKKESSEEPTELTVKVELEEDPVRKINAKSMKMFFDKKIIGQDTAKKDVIAAIIMNKLSDNPADKNSCLLVGPTGSGKTLIAETVSEYFDMPIIIIDTTQLTMPGYVGANIEDFLVRLLAKAGGDVAKAEEGIVVLDEIDKKGSEKNDDVSGKGVLNTLLPFIQGTTYDVKYNNRLVHFDTKKLTIFATGAFTDVAKAKKSGKTDEGGYHYTRIGFNADKAEDKKDSEDIEYPVLEVEDFVKYGNIPAEMMGRFTTVAQLSGHTIESLRNILTGSSISPLLAERAKLQKIGVNLSWTTGYLDAVAKEAIKLKTGARSLKSTVEKSVKEARWEVLCNPDDYCSVILTEKSVNDNYDVELVDQNGESHSLKEIIIAKGDKALEEVFSGGSKTKILVK